MLDLHTLLTAYPSLQSSPLVLALLNAAVIAYHLLTHHRQAKPGQPAKSRKTKAFTPTKIYSPWSDAWIAKQEAMVNDWLMKGADANFAPTLVRVRQAQNDLGVILKAFPDANFAPTVQERLFRLEQLSKVCSASLTNDAVKKT